MLRDGVRGRLPRPVPSGRAIVDVERRDGQRRRRGPPVPPRGITRMTTTAHTTTAHLTEADIDEFGRELDRIRDEVIAARGEADARYIRRVIAVQRGMEAGGRALLFVSILPPAWLAGTAALATAKILENMEIGHNVLHGQWDWMRDPEIHSTHLGMGLRDPRGGVEALAQLRAPHVHQRARQGPRHRLQRSCASTRSSRGIPSTSRQPFYNLAARGVLRVGHRDLRRRARTRLARREELAQATGRAARRRCARPRRQVIKDYVAFPLLAGPSVPAGAARQPHRQRDPQRVDPHDHLLRPLPRRRRGLHRGRSSTARPAASGTCASCWARPTSTAARSSTS